ncbi:MAG: oligosaccharide flippase family protein, partial [Patescibacteria group bacterium]|nr:oligosaccharide flippase family protein [Patescibacteria group bacterium]
LVLARWLMVREDNPRRFLGEMLRMFAVLAVATAAVGLALCMVAPDPVWRRLAALGLVILIAQSWFELNLTLASVQFAPARYGRILGAKAVLAAAFGTGLAWLGLGPDAPLLGLLLGCLLSVALFGRGPWHKVRLARAERHELRDQLRYGLPLIVSFALGWIIVGSDRLLIGWLLDVKAAGQYAVGYDLAQYGMGILAVVHVAAYPLAVRALETHGPAGGAVQLAQNGELVVGLALAAAAGLMVLAPQAAAVVVGHEFRESTERLLPWCALAAGLGGAKAFHFDLAFHLGRDTRGLVAVGAAAAMVNVGLNLLWIPRFGIDAAAYASVAAFLLGVLLSAWLGRQAFAMPPTIRLLLRTGSVAIAAAAGAACGGVFGVGLAGLIGGGLAGALAAVIVAFLIDLANVRTGFARWRSSRNTD